MSSSEDEESSACIPEEDIVCSLTRSDDSDTDTESETMDHLAEMDMLLPSFDLQDDEYHNILSAGMIPSAESFIVPGAMSQYLQHHQPAIYSKAIQVHGGQGSIVYIPAAIINRHQFQISHPRPNSVLCDAFVFHPSWPIMLLTFSTQTKSRVSRYNASVARAGILLLSSHLQDTFTFVHGVIDTATWQSDTLFAEKIREFETSAENFSVPISLQMTEVKCRSAIKVLLRTDSGQVNRTRGAEENLSSVWRPMSPDENCDKHNDVLGLGYLVFFGKAVKRYIFEELFPYPEEL
ncbi:uncharacterized protein LOC124260918 isoform X3 [Haliotis rubra]|uniref:uncharacterized protein LOC124260918 isoform X3 n=1 Tax=Haliotis rubra TaxID=36100 RepID=UPI001EE62CB3|nr:uncharacterized protein LOC124260918 isoform X3 [Haliotis rubra]